MLTEFIWTMTSPKVYQYLIYICLINFSTDSHSYGIGYNTMSLPNNSNPLPKFYFVMPTYNAYFHIQDDMYWAWNTSKPHSTSVLPLNSYPVDRYIGIIAVTNKTYSKIAEFHQKKVPSEKDKPLLTESGVNTLKFANKKQRFK